MAAYKLFLSIFVISVLCIRELSAAGCSTSEVSPCWGNMTNRYQNFPSSETDVPAYCSGVGALCSSTLTVCFCGLTATCQDFLGLKDAVQYLCNYTDVRTLYQNNRQCILNNTDTLFSSCRTTYGTASCSAYNDLFRCFYNGMKSACSTDVAKMMTKFQLNRSGPQLKDISCTVDTSSYDSAGDVIAPSVVTAAVVAATVLIQLFL